MTEVKHTPLHLPLKVTDSPIKRHNRISIVDAGRCHVADIAVNLEDANPTYTVQEKQEIAAFIVRACNSHYELVEALERADKILKKLYIQHGDNLDDDVVHWEIYQRGINVIAKAKGAA